jgi:hypothetical protein
MNRVIYKNLNNSVSILIPAQEVLDVVGLKAIAEKDVPHNLPYWFANVEDIPKDRNTRSVWIIDDSIGEPDGYGGASNEFTQSQLLELYNKGVIKND